MCVTGTLIYRDTIGHVANFINVQHVMVDVHHAWFTEERGDGAKPVQQTGEGNSKGRNVQPVTKMAFNHSFVVQSISVESRKAESITYVIKLIDANYYKFMQKVSYSDYKKEQTGEKTGSFLKVRDIMAKSEIGLSADTFKEQDSENKFDYVSKANDTVGSAVKYLMNKMFYYEKREKKMKFLGYDDINDKYFAMSIANPLAVSDGTKIVFSMDYSQMETLSQQKDNQMATLVSRPKSSQMSLIQPKRIYGYVKNMLSADVISSKELINYYSATSDNAEVDKKVEDIDDTKDMYCDTYQFCNNNLNLYDRTVADMTENNSLVVNTSGHMARQPGMKIDVVIQNDKAGSGSENPKQEEDRKNRYLGLAGSWMVFRVRHIICPAAGKQSYTQNLVLFKNAVEKKSE